MSKPRTRNDLELRGRQSVHLESNKGTYMSSGAESTTLASGQGSWRIRSAKAEWIGIAIKRIDQIAVQLATSFSTDNEVQQLLSQRTESVRGQLQEFVNHRSITQWRKSASMFELISVQLDGIEEDLILYVKPSVAQAQIPILRADMRQYLDRLDTRYEYYGRLLDDIDRKGVM
jgi:hypothetical protein